MTNKLESIEGIGRNYATTLRQAGVKSCEDLLAQGQTKHGRQLISAKCGISEALILKWVNMADLFRVKGIASQYSQLLEVAGVDTVKELRNRNADNLVAKLKEINKTKFLVRKTPSMTQVRNWIEQTKSLPPAITY